MIKSFIHRKDQIEIYVPAAYRFENILVEIIQETLGGRFDAFNPHAGGMAVA